MAKIMKNRSLFSGFLGMFLLAFLTFATVSLAKQPHEQKSAPVEQGTQCNIAIFRGTQQIATATGEFLSGLPTIEYKHPGAGKPQSGPRLQEVLAAFKIADFRSIKVFGFAKGRVAAGEYVISKDKLHDQVLLGYSRRGTVKLVVPELAFDDWLVDVYKLEIE